MKKYIIQLQSGLYVESFQKCSIVVSETTSRAGKYTQSVAEKRISNSRFSVTLANCKIIENI